MTNTVNPHLNEATDLHDMVVVHRVFRRELRSIPELLRSAQSGDLERASVVGGHVRLVLSGLHLHHTSEDDLLWPLLVRRAGSAAELVERMQAQHAVVEELGGRLGPLLNRWEIEARPAIANEVAGLIDRLRIAVVGHLDDEERLILPIAAWNITPGEWAAVGEAGVAKMSRAELPLMFGCVMEDASPLERRQLLRSLPFPARLLMRTWGARHYRRYITTVRGEG